jgi:hypothetical protein
VRLVAGDEKVGAYDIADSDEAGEVHSWPLHPRPELPSILQC